ncbi:hypothetical protein HYC85_028299 [Camellia sinensis]|uniref:MULE transposase domain-containing protein n=1 Tax=Camellia sinensis TaxID=4442 RepID=A0A7J7FWV1_CAMSI|nr:hypothetical protein HYC85_028299 [Camellia sinensis]
MKKSSVYLNKRRQDMSDDDEERRPTRSEDERRATKTLHDEHTCRAAVRTSKNSRMSSNLVTSFFPLAMAIVNMETTDSWEWFFMHLSNILLDERPITFISDRNARLLEALPKVLPTAYHYFYLQHLKANLRDRQKYGEMHSNVTGSFNSWIRQARHLPTTKMIDSIRLKIIDLMSRRREQAKKWNTFLSGDGFNITMDDLVVLPPICKKPSGRTRKNRIPFSDKKIRRVQCGKCEKYGHNRKTCKETLP